MAKKPAIKTIHVGGEILKDLELLVCWLEERAADKELGLVSASYLHKAAQYLRLIFPPHHELYRTPYLRVGNSAVSVTAESAVRAAGDVR